MKRIIIWSVLLLAAAMILYFYAQTGYWLTRPTVSAVTSESRSSYMEEDEKSREEFNLLLSRKDAVALNEFENTLANNPNHTGALWGKAEVLIRKGDYAEAERILNSVLTADAEHINSLLSLAYLKDRTGKIEEALRCLKKVLILSADRNKQALAYVVLGDIKLGHAKRSMFLSKLRALMQVKAFFLKAEELGTNLPDTHLALGEFYLLAPPFLGGDLEKSIAELKQAVALAPQFAAAHALLAEAYRKKGDMEKYNFYLYQANELSPADEVLQEIQGK